MIPKHRDYKVEPFLKWAGGKRWLVKSHSSIFPKKYRNYYEPFIGGGAVFFHLQPQTSVLADKNPALINAYQEIKNNWLALEEKLKEHQFFHAKDYYYLTRAQHYETPLEQAAQFIYLNRTCWNGLFRVNLKGQFNVPIGTKNNVLMPGESLKPVSDALANTELLSSDFEPIIDQAEDGDLVFADPPYTVKHNNNGFIKYNESIFSWEDQERLAETLYRASLRGAHIISTNANHDSVRELYREKFDIKILDRSSILAGKKTARGNTTEILIRSTSIE